MRKPFHTFLNGNSECQNSLFYTGVMNPLMKKMLLQNVQDLIEQKTGSSSISRVFETSSACLKTLEVISHGDGTKPKKTPSAVLFNLHRHPDLFQLQLGISTNKKHLAVLEQALNEIHHEIQSETLNTHHTATETLFALHQLRTLLKNQSNFSWEIREMNETECFLTLKFNIAHEPISS